VQRIEHCLTIESEKRRLKLKADVTVELNTLLKLHFVLKLKPNID